jgi:hypothetical protein
MDGIGLRYLHCVHEGQDQKYGGAFFFFILDFFGSAEQYQPPKGLDLGQIS